MAVLSFSQEHEAGVTIVQNGKIVAAINEERLTRVKNQAGFPEKSLLEALQIASMKSEDIDIVVIPEISKLKDFLFNVIPRYPLNVFVKGKAKFPGVLEFMKQFVMSFYILSKTYLRIGISHYQDIRKLRKMFPNAQFQRVEHHVAHAASVFFTSGFDKGLIVSTDYWGDYVSTMVCIGEGKDIKVISRSYFPHSLGHYYASLTKWLGFKANRHEGKILGLAAYGNPNSPAYSLMKDMLFCEGLQIRAPFMMGKMWHHRIPIHKNTLMRRLIKTYPREDIAAVFQRRFEEVITELVKNCLKKYPLKNILLVGGSFANVKLNQRVFEVKGIENIFIFPNMTDGGISSGAALYVDIIQNGNTGHILPDVYFGPSFNDDQIEQALINENISYSYCEDIEIKVAHLLAEGKIIARFNGRMEFGPRALGNRSILYQANDPSVNDWLNKKLGRTEFMPFAPLTLSEHAGECYLNLKGAEYPAKFMTITFDCTEYMKKVSPATVHVDGTARPQLIDEATNPSYYKILKEYYRLTGIPSIINTSFNMHEEPIVCTPSDAIRAFKMGHLDYLAIGPFLAVLDDSK
ncbi:carbamoyltransferase [bacterium]|nr:carbamoyltransferase [bacterium]